ncbi:MAG: hypothetical protein ACRDV1_10585 [Actinomycetes bacterium]
MNATKRCCTCGSMRPLAEFNVRTAAAASVTSAAWNSIIVTDN